ncbi:MAG: uracil-DNA glycosylase [Actinobacteria bacterium]|nr:uracil-DNA glycosylase [Actinomycetota bacterium]
MEWLGLLPKVKRTNVAVESALAKSFTALDTAIHACDACPRLVHWREEVAITKRKSYQDQEYWGKPVSGFGSNKPRLLIIGLAPGAHGANRTGRVFTGDSSGDWLYGSLHRIGIAKIPTSTSANDGQFLRDTRITAAVRCAPPGNAPTIEERDTCAPWLLREVQLALPTVRAFVALGAFAWSATIRALISCGHVIPKTKFGHGVEVRYSNAGMDYLLIGSYHPSQQNTFTGKLTRDQLDSVLRKGAEFSLADE